MKRTTSLPKLIDKILEDRKIKALEHALKRKAEGASFRPSSLGSPCLRKVYYSYKRVVPDHFPEARNHRIFDIGDAIHELLANYLRESGVLIDYYNPDGSYVLDSSGKADFEFPISAPELEIPRGKVDGIGVINNKLWVYEYKSSNDRKFKELKTAADSRHVIQAMTYVFAFEKMLKDGAYSHIKELEGFNSVEGIKFLYFNKNDGQLKEFTHKKNYEVFEDILKKVLTIKDYDVKNELPPKTEDYCRWCDFRDKCAKNALE